MCVCHLYLSLRFQGFLRRFTGFLELIYQFSFLFQPLLLSLQLQNETTIFLYIGYQICLKLVLLFWNWYLHPEICMIYRPIVNALNKFLPNLWKMFVVILMAISVFCCMVLLHLCGFQSCQRLWILLCEYVYPVSLRNVSDSTQVLPFVPEIMHGEVTEVFLHQKSWKVAI